MMSPPPEMVSCIPTRLVAPTRHEPALDTTQPPDPVARWPEPEQATLADVREEPIVDPARWRDLIVLPAPGHILTVMPEGPDGLA